MSVLSTLSNTFSGSTSTTSVPAATQTPGFFEEGGFVDRHRFGVGAGVGGLVGILGYWAAEKLLGSASEDEYDAAVERLKNKAK